MPDRSLKVWGDSGIFTIKLPEDAKVTFGPWAPPNARMTEEARPSKGSAFGPERGGTLRIYRGSRTTGDVLAVFAGVQGFRDTSLEYEEEPRFAPEPEPIAEVGRISVAWAGMDEEEKEDLAARIATAMAHGAVDAAMAEEEEKDATEPLPF